MKLIHAMHANIAADTRNLDCVTVILAQDTVLVSVRYLFPNLSLGTGS